MAVELRWITNRSVSCLHAVAALAEQFTPEGTPAAMQPSFDHDLAAALLPATRELCLAIGDNVTERRKFFEHLLPLAAGVEPNRELATLVLRKLHGSKIAEEAVSHIAATLATLKSAYAERFPTLLDELELRSGPLREQWEARGPGLLHSFTRLTEPELVPELADVLLVAPVLGGGGVAHLAYNSVRIEAVLAHPYFELPETVRLGWLLSQLNSDIPRHAENLSPATAAQVIAIATLPGVLAAASYVELVRDESALLARALELWQPAGRHSAQLAAPLAAWWATYRDTRPCWAVALRALEQMIAGELPEDELPDVELPDDETRQ